MFDRTYYSHCTMVSSVIAISEKTINMKRIYVDFNSTQDDDLGVYVPVAEQINGAPRAELDNLADGELVVIFMKDVEMDAVIERDPRNGFWIARPNWSTKRFLPE